MLLPVARAAGSVASPTIWIFDTEFRGEASVRRGAAEAVDGARVFAWPSLDAASVARAARETGGSPDLVVHSFSNSEDDAHLERLRAQSEGRTRLVLVGSHGGRPELFDLLIRPHHLPPLAPELEVRTLRIFGLPTRVKRAPSPASRFGEMPGPRVVALIGGRTAAIDFGEDLGARLGRALRNLGAGTLLVTNSRRTPRRTYEALLAEARPDVRVDARFGDENPYLELLAAADHLVVTGDSMAMIADGLRTGKPVHLFAPREIMEEQHLRFNLPLVERGFVRPLKAPLENWAPPELDVDASIARRCRALLEAR